MGPEASTRHSYKVGIAAPHAGLRKAKLERPALQPQWDGGGGCRQTHLSAQQEEGRLASGPNTRTLPSLHCAHFSHLRIKMGTTDHCPLGQDSHQSIPGGCLRGPGHGCWGKTHAMLLW